MKYLSIIFVLTLLFSCRNNTQSSKVYKYPKTEKYPIKNTYFRLDILDEYRHLENLKDSATIAWFEDQDAFSDKYLRELPSYKLLKQQLSDYNKDNEKSVSKIKYDPLGQSFFLKRDVTNPVGKLYYKKSKNSEAIELYDPAAFNKALGREYTINYLQPSWDGKHVVVSLSHDGVFGSDMIIIEVETGRVLPEVITQAEPDLYLGISWLPDSSGFMYLYLPVTDDTKEDYMLDCHTVLHKLGGDPNKRQDIFSSSNVKGITNEDMPIAKVLSKNDKYIIGYRASVENYWETYYADIKDLERGKINWKPFYGLDKKIYADYGYFLDDDFVGVSGQGADNRKIVSFNVNTTHDIKTLVPEKEDEVITTLFVANNSLFYTTSKYGVEAFLYQYNDNKETQVPLPKPSGEISLYSVQHEHTFLYVGLEGWTSDFTKYIYDGKAFSIDPLSSHKAYPEFEGFQNKEIEVSSHDGAGVPLSLVYRSDIKLDGSNPTFLYAYGAYGEIMTPYFSTMFLNWVQNGGVLAIPHIRGGGEKGDSWHEAGMKSKKSNSWKDLIACTEYLIDKKYTSSNKTVLYSVSAGGIAIGMAMVERPDLFEVVIADAPMLNPLRGEERSNDATNHLEYGTVKDSTECMALIDMDPYVNLKPQVDYPACLVITGFNDARIDPWIPGKFVAKLQSYSTSNKPVFLDVLYEAGHEGGDTKEEWIELYAKIFAFAFWQTDHNLNP